MTRYYFRFSFPFSEKENGLFCIKVTSHWVQANFRLGCYCIFIPVTHWLDTTGGTWQLGSTESRKALLSLLSSVWQVHGSGRFPPLVQNTATKGAVRLDAVTNILRAPSVVYRISNQYDAAGYFKVLQKFSSKKKKDSSPWQQTTDWGKAHKRVIE
jgi:hypothetical protein